MSYRLLLRVLWKDPLLKILLCHCRCRISRLLLLINYPFAYRPDAVRQRVGELLDQVFLLVVAIGALVHQLIGGILLVLHLYEAVFEMMFVINFFGLLSAFLAFWFRIITVRATVMAYE